jgi:hypothetical protein
MPPHATSWRPILLLSSHLRLGLPSCLFPSDFPTKNLYKKCQQSTEIKLFTARIVLVPYSLVRLVTGPEQSLQRARRQRTAVFCAMYRPVLRLIQVRNVRFPARMRAGAFRLQGTSTETDSTDRFTVHIIILSSNHQMSFPASSSLLLTQPQSLSFTARNPDGRCSLRSVDWMFNDVLWH